MGARAVPYIVMIHDTAITFISKLSLARAALPSPGSAKPLWGTPTHCYRVSASTCFIMARPVLTQTCLRVEVREHEYIVAALILHIEPFVRWTE